MTSKPRSSPAGGDPPASPANRDTGPLVDQAAEPLLEAFEEAWQRGEPRLEDFLRRWTGPPEAVLAELAIIDLEYRIKRAESPALARYVASYPLLAHDHGFQATATRLLDQALRAKKVADLASSGLDGAAEDCRHEDFAIEQPLGRGGMATVHLARRRSTGQAVAIKVLASVGSNRDEKVVRFLREARAARRLDHPNIVSVHGVGRMPAGELFIVMDFVSGGSLNERISAGTLPSAEVIRIVASVADAVEHAHAHGVIHRDLKPANVLLTDRGDVRVSDFGLAKILGGAELTITVGAVGTAGFMAPEQADRRLGPIGPRTDVYGLGGILYAAFTGRPPFVGHSLFEVLAVVCGGQPPPSPRSLRPDLPAAVEAVCLACLCKAPADRPASAALVAAALRDCSRHNA